MEESFITPTHIKDYLFCPTLFYNKYVRGIIEPKTELMLKGTSEYMRDKGRWMERKTLLRDRRLKVDRMVFAKPLTSRKYRIHGVADTIFWINRKMNVLEIKYGGSPKLFRDHLYQTAAYALMAEEEFKQPAYKLIIFYKKEGKWFERRFTAQLRSHLIKIIEEIWKVLEGGVIPEFKPKRMCGSCWYRRFCYPP